MKEILCLAFLVQYKRSQSSLSSPGPPQSTLLPHSSILQGESRGTDVFEMDITEQVEGVEAWVGGN